VIPFPGISNNSFSALLGVAFTDLHCSPASLNTCLEVLEEVHRVALERNAGVLFLGDFWHHRGTLRVDCLNAVLEHFRSWEVPMIMIPGNHDQVTLGGHSHGLTPFENAYRVGDVAGPLVLSYPTKFRNALFIPHIRDTATMESVLQSSSAHESSALFVHAEVTGALMNDLLVSTGGVPPASFPPNKRIYSGHFHKPHTVKSSNVDIEYLGSPYETTLAEAQQQKMLAVLDAEWKCSEYVPLNIGRRHFKISSWKDLLQLQLQTEGKNNAYLNGAVKSEDRVVVSVPKEEAATIQATVGSHIKMLREAGVTVEVREVKTEPLGRADIQGVKGLEEEMTTESTWSAYLDEEAKRESLSANNARILLEAGLEVLEEIDSSGELKMHTNEATDLQLNKVSVEGFGPFQSRLTYPLLDRGLVLLKGSNFDGGSDSNGSGKTSLAMASLWALTGSLDPRRAQDGKVSDVINDYSKVCFCNP
jgi:DNA repair exonuclease SbcCD nuclease subunit